MLRVRYSGAWRHCLYLPFLEPFHLNRLSCLSVLLRRSICRIGAKLGHRAGPRGVMYSAIRRGARMSMFSWRTMAPDNGSWQWYCRRRRTVYVGGVGCFGFSNRIGTGSIGFVSLLDKVPSKTVSSPMSGNSAAPGGVYFALCTPFSCESGRLH